MILKKAEIYEQKNNVDVIRFSYIALLAGLMLTSLGYVFKHVDRIGLYLSGVSMYLEARDMSDENMKQLLVVQSLPTG